MWMQLQCGGQTAGGAAETQTSSSLTVDHLKIMARPALSIHPLKTPQTSENSRWKLLCLFSIKTNILNFKNTEPLNNNNTEKLFAMFVR